MKAAPEGSRLCGVLWYQVRSAVSSDRLLLTYSAAAHTSVVGPLARNSGHMCVKLNGRGSACVKSAVVRVVPFPSPFDGPKIESPLDEIKEILIV